MDPFEAYMVFSGAFTPGLAFLVALALFGRRS
jgi:hypothetical protein